MGGVDTGLILFGRREKRVGIPSRARRFRRDERGSVITEAREKPREFCAGASPPVKTNDHELGAIGRYSSGADRHAGVRIRRIEAFEHGAYSLSPAPIGTRC